MHQQVKEPAHEDEEVKWDQMEQGSVHPKIHSYLVAFNDFALLVATGSPPPRRGRVIVEALFLSRRIL